MSFLVTVHLDNRLRAHKRTGSTSGARLILVELCMRITLSIELWGYPDDSLWAKRHAKVATLAFFVMNNYFSLHNPAKK
jgi:hypothetical protein